MATLGSGDKNHPGGDGPIDQERPEIRLEQDGQHGEAGGHHGRAESEHTDLLSASQHRGEHHDQGNLPELGRLQPVVAELEPAAGAPDLNPGDEDGNQRRQESNVDRSGQPEDPPMSKPCGEEHRCDTDPGEHGLPVEIGRLGRPKIGRRAPGGRVDHECAEGGQGRGQEHQDQVDMA